MNDDNESMKTGSTFTSSNHNEKSSKASRKSNRSKSKPKSRESEDRKNKERSRVAGVGIGVVSSLPGAHASNGGSKRERSKRESDDEKARGRRHRESAKASAVGAVSAVVDSLNTRERRKTDRERSSARSRTQSRSKSPDSRSSTRKEKEEADPKRRERHHRHSTEASAVGAVSVVNSNTHKRRKADQERSRTRSRSKSLDSRRSSRRRVKEEADAKDRERRHRHPTANNEIPVNSQEEGECAVAAEVAEDEEERSTREYQQHREQVPCGQEAGINVTANYDEEAPAGDTKNLTKNDDHNNSGSKRSTLLVFFCCCFILVAIGSTVAGLYGAGILSFSSNLKVIENPTEAPQESPPVAPDTDSPSSAPTFLVYDPISPDQCDAVAKGGEVDGQEDMIEKRFALILDSQLAFNMEPTLLLETMHQKIQGLLAPKMTGCDDTLSRRRRRSLNAKDHDEYKYIVGNLVVIRVVETGEECSPASAGNIYCLGMRVEIGIFVRGNDLSTLDYIAKLSRAMNGESFDLVIELGLDHPFRKVLLVELLTLDPTAAPAIATPAPTNPPSVSPTQFPTAIASSNPSLMPVDAPVTSEPTKVPTKAPTPAPTIPAASANPTRTASSNPTKAPSSAPSGAPSSTPSESPSLLPSVVPSSAPSKIPTKEPSSIPSKSPSLEPSLSPSNGPLEDDLYCGCTLDSYTTKNLPHMGPSNLSQQDCIRYCRDADFTLAGLFVNQCHCGDSIIHGTSFECNYKCPIQGPGNCYDDSDHCMCGGSGDDDPRLSVFRTSTAVTCPIAYFDRPDLSTATWAVEHPLHPGNRAVDRNASSFTLHDNSVSYSEYVLTADLGFSPYEVTKVWIYNRWRCGWDCLKSVNGVTLELLDDNQNVISGTTRRQSMSSNGQDSPTIYPNDFADVTGVRYIRLRKSKNFQIGEIFVDGRAYPGV